VDKITNVLSIKTTGIVNFLNAQYSKVIKLRMMSWARKIAQ